MPHPGSVSECYMQDDVDGVGSVVTLGAVSARRCHAHHHGKEESPPCPDPIAPLTRGVRQRRASVRRLALCRFAERRRSALPPCGGARPVSLLGGPFRGARPRTLATCCPCSAILHARVVAPLPVIVASLLARPFPSGAWGHFAPWPRRACGVGAHGPQCRLCDREDSYLVDPASSHMLVSKIKPCMSKYKQLYGETANGSLNQL